MQFLAPSQPVGSTWQDSGESTVRIARPIFGNKQAAASKPAWREGRTFNNNSLNPDV